MEKIGQSIQWEPLFSLGQAAELHIQFGRGWYIQTSSSQVQEIKKLIYPSSSQIYPVQLHVLIQLVELTNSALLSSKFAVNRKESVLTSGQKHVMDAVLVQHTSFAHKGLLRRGRWGRGVSDKKSKSLQLGLRRISSIDWPERGTSQIISNGQPADITQVKDFKGSATVLLLIC